MRIGFDLRSLQTGSPPWGLGVYTSNLVNSLSRIDKENDYFLISHKGREFDTPFVFPPEFRENVLHVPRFPKYLGVVRDRLMLKGELAKFKLDLVHFPSPFQLSLDFDLRREKTRSVITIHDLTPLLYGNEIFTGKRRILKIIYHYLIRSVKHVSAVIASSDNTKADLTTLLKIPEEKIAVIRDGVSHEFTAQLDGAALERAKEKYGLPPQYLLYVGNFFPFKNLGRLFKALQLLEAREGISIPLVIGGIIHPFFKPALEKDVRDAGLCDRVLLKGYIDQADLPALYHLARAFVYPSLYEGFGLPPLEAMACGTPVACSSSSSLPEIMGDAAIQFDPHSIDSIAEALRRILCDERLREELETKGPAQAAKFTWDSCAEATLEVYRKSAGR
jgi:glycosyltransferase involved in cell wall biosynthesis